MTIEGVDYAWSRPRPAVLSSLGKRFACRYVSYDTTGKNLTPMEVGRLVSAGIAVVTNWEWTAAGALGGYSAGVSHARDAHRMAVSCGMPPDRPIYFSVDFNPTAAQLSTVDAYMDGCASVIGRNRVGVYGGYNTVRHLAANGKAQWFWQTYAWSGGLWHPGNHIEQYRNGVTIDSADCDLDRALTVDYGQWGTEADIMTADYGAIGAPPNVPDYAANFPAVMIADLWAALVGGKTGWGPESDRDRWDDVQRQDAQLTAVLDAIGRIPGSTGGWLSDVDRQLFTDLKDAVVALNNRLATP